MSEQKDICHTFSRMAKMSALNVRAAECNARIAAMQCGNQWKISQGELPTYDEDRFWKEAHVLGEIADELSKI